MMSIKEICNQKEFLRKANILWRRASQEQKHQIQQTVISRLNNLLDKGRYDESPATIQLYLKQIGNLRIKDINQCLSCCKPERFQIRYKHAKYFCTNSPTICVTIQLDKFYKIDQLICAIANSGQGCIVVAKETKQNKASKGFSSISIAERSKIVDQIFKAYQSLGLSKKYINIRIDCIKFLEGLEQKDEFIIRISITVDRRKKNRLVFCYYPELKKQYQRCRLYQFQYCKQTNRTEIQQALQSEYYQKIYKKHRQHVNQGDLSYHHCIFNGEGLQFTGLDKFVQKFDRTNWNQQIDLLDYLKQTDIMQRLPIIKQKDVYAILHTNSQNQLDFVNKFKTVLSQCDMTFQCMQIADIFPLIWKQIYSQNKKSPTFFIIRQSQKQEINNLWKKAINNDCEKEKWLFFANEETNFVLKSKEHQMLSMMCFPGRVSSREQKNGSFTVFEVNIKISIYLLFVQSLVHTIDIQKIE